jgi:hypothetical protein
VRERRARVRDACQTSRERMDEVGWACAARVSGWATEEQWRRIAERSAGERETSGV